MIVADRFSMWMKKKRKILPGSNFIVYISDSSKSVTINTHTLDGSSSECTVDWGDGTAGVNLFSHTYAASGLYTINISDDLSSLGFGSGKNHGVAILSFGSKITSIPGQGFLNWKISLGNIITAFGSVVNYLNYMISVTKDLVVDIPATSIGSYALDSLQCTNVRFTALQNLQGSMFYAGGLAAVLNLYFTNANINIPGDYLNDWSSFMFGWTKSSSEPDNPYEEKNVFFENNTLAEIRSKSNFPWRATNSPVPVYFHGTDGMMDKNGNAI